MKRIQWILTVVVMVLALPACSESGTPGKVFQPGAESGTMAVVFQAPTGEIGAVSFTIRGAEMGDPERTTDLYQIYTQPVSGGWEIAVVGEELDGELIQFEVADLGRAVSDLSVTLNEVANHRNELVADLSAFELKLTPVQ